MIKKRFFSSLRFYISSACILTFLSPLYSNTPNTLKNQKNINTTLLNYKYKQAKSSKIHYIYDSYGKKIVTLNFNQYGNLSSKTYYQVLGKKERRYILDDDCKKIDCYFFIH